VSDEESRRFWATINAHKKASDNKHTATRLEMEGIRDEVRAGNEDRRALHGENTKRFESFYQDQREQNLKLDALLAIEATKKAAREERERLAKTVGIAAKVFAAIIGALAGAVGFAKLVYELWKTHKP